MFTFTGSSDSESEEDEDNKKYRSKWRMVLNIKKIEKAMSHLNLSP